MTKNNDLTDFKSWKSCKLGDCVTFLSGGTPSKKKPEYWDGNIPWVSCKDMKRSYLYDSQDHITEEGAANGTRLVSPETILIVVRGMILSQQFPVAIAKRKMAFNQDLKALECAPHVDPKFLFYWLQGKSYEVLGIADEAAHGTKRLQTDRLQNFPLYLPPVPIQRKIAAILSAYDDLIENNMRRIKILEEMARSLYREWFVNFHFPGHQQVKMIDSELGLIPEGWEVKKLKDVVELAYGKSLTANKRIAGKVPVYGSAGVVGYHNESLVNGPGVIVGRKGNVGSVFWSDDDFFPIDTVFYVQTEMCLHYIYYNLQNQNFINNDAAVPGLNRNQAYLLHFLIPPMRLLSKFEHFVNGIFKQTKILRLKNDNLRQTRDLLLPKLISGEIDVENLDINNGNIAA